MRGIGDRDPINLQPGVNHTGRLLVWASLSARAPRLFPWPADYRAVSQQRHLTAVKIQTRWQSHDGCPESTMSWKEEGVEEFQFAYLMSYLSLYSSVFSQRLETSGCIRTGVGGSMLFVVPFAFPCACLCLDESHFYEWECVSSPYSPEAVICRCHNPL